MDYRYNHQNIKNNWGKLISKIILGLFFVTMLFQANQIYGIEERPVITIDFVSGNIIDLDASTQMLRAEVQIQHYDPGDGFHYMQVIRLSDGEIIKDTEIFPKVIGGSEDDNLYEVQILHYLEPDDDDQNLIGDYGLRIYSELGAEESVETFSVIKSSMPITIIPDTVEELTTSNSTSDTVEELTTSNSTSDVVEDTEESEIEDLVEPESKIPTWVHDIFVWYADEIISENELLTALQYLIEQGILVVDSN